MADQALHRPGAGSRARRSREASIAAPVAIVGSIAFHALVLGYLALLGLSGDKAPFPGPISDPLFPDPYDGIPVELVPPASGEGRRLRLSWVVPHDRRHFMEQSAEQSPDFHLPQRGRPLAVAARSPDAPETHTPDTNASSPSDAASSPIGGRPAPFSGPARTSTLACRTLAGTLTFEEQTICDERFGSAAAGARVIAGTNNPRRDARFAAEGQAELDAYEALRAPLKPPTPCEGADMMGRCPAIIQIPLFSRKF